MTPRSRRIVVNQSFALQRVTGQQRYATEIAKRLVGRDGFEQAGPRGFWAQSSLRVWLWVMAALPLAARSAVVLSMTARAPLWQRRHILVVHDLFVLTNPEWFSRAYVWTHAPLLRMQLRAASALVAVSQPVADQLARYGGPVPVPVAPNAPSEVFSTTSPVDPTAAEPGGTLASRGLMPGQYFLAVGSLDPRKNLPLLAKAYGALSEQERKAHPLVVVGGGNAVFRDEEIDWPPEVVDAGYVTDEQLRELYQGSLAVVLVSLAEGFGLPLVEAAAAGAPCLVVSDIPVFRWVCQDKAHFVDPSSVGSVAAGLRAAVSAPIRTSVELERFTWGASADIVSDVCRAVAAGR